MTRYPALLSTLLLASLFGLCLPLAAQQTPLAAVPPPLPPAQVGPRLFLGDQNTDTIYALQDTNQDGDCNDAGEISVFYDSTSPDPALHLGLLQFIAWGPDDALYVGDSSNDFILRLKDLDQDGTANQPGEAQVFYDASSGGPALVSINNIVFDASGALFYSDNGTSSTTDRTIVRLQDLNGDGTCTVADGEVQVVYQLSTTTGTPLARPSALAIDSQGFLLVSNYDDDDIYALWDTTGAEDGDANDSGEQNATFISNPMAVQLAFVQSMVLGPADPMGVQPLYANDPTPDTIFRLRDGGGDGIFDNPLDVNVFWDATQADGIIPGFAWRIAVDPSGALFVADGGQSAAGVPPHVVVLRDLNGNGTANDTGEATIYADNSNLSGVTFDRPYALAFELAPPPIAQFIRGDTNADGAIDLADAISNLSYIFASGAADCIEALDVDDTGTVDIADPINLLNYLFVAGSPPPPAPFPSCGADPTPDALDCAAFVTCP